MSQRNGLCVIDFAVYTVDDDDGRDDDEYGEENDECGHDRNNAPINYLPPVAEVTCFANYLPDW